MLARQKWQITTISVLEDVFAERVAAVDSGLDAVEDLPSRIEDVNGRSLAEQIVEESVDVLDADALVQLAAVCVAMVEDLAREED